MTATTNSARHGERRAPWQPSARTAWLFTIVTVIAVVTLLGLLFRPSTGTRTSSVGLPTTTPGSPPNSSVTGGADAGGFGGDGSSSGTSGAGAGAPFAGESASGTSTEGGSESPPGQPSGLASAPSGETGAILSAVSDPPGPVTSVLVPNSDPTYALVTYGGSASTFVLLQQGGGISPAGDDQLSSAGAGWTELGQGSPQLPCIYGLPLSVASTLAGMMQFCG